MLWRLVHRTPPSCCLYSTIIKGYSTRWIASYTPVIGLELHVKLQTAAKLFSAASTKYNDPPNTTVSAFDAALPGTLPRLNVHALRLAIQTALALDCTIALESRFDRKHYTYHDLPAGYQITQKYHPIAKDGLVRVQEQRLEPFSVGIEQVQLEQDTAKSSIDIDSGCTLIDLNRSGVPLVEIVTRPDIQSSEQAVAFVKSVQRILRCIKASDGDMEAGSLRIDVNVSAKSKDGLQDGSRCEIKNLNSTRFMAQAIDAEFNRQIAALAKSEPKTTLANETRGFDPVTKQTFLLRTKENAPDYRYMPDPELGPVILTEAWISKLRDALPELPRRMLERLQTKYGLSEAVAHRLMRIGEAEEMPMSTPFAPAVAYFEQAADGVQDGAIANWLTQDVMANLTKAGLGFGDLESRLPPRDLRNLVSAVTSKTLTATTGKTFLAKAILDQADVDVLLEEHKAATSNIPSAAQLATSIIQEHPKQTTQYKKGEDKVLMWLVGQAMRKSKGRADANAIVAEFKRQLG